MRHQVCPLLLTARTCLADSGTYLSGTHQVDPLILFQQTCPAPPGLPLPVQSDRPILLHSIGYMATLGTPFLVSPVDSAPSHPIASTSSSVISFPYLPRQSLLLPTLWSILSSETGQISLFNFMGLPALLGSCFHMLPGHLVPPGYSILTLQTRTTTSNPINCFSSVFQNLQVSPTSLYDIDLLTTPSFLRALAPNHRLSRATDGESYTRRLQRRGPTRVILTLGWCLFTETKMGSQKRTSDRALSSNTSITKQNTSTFYSLILSWMLYMPTLKQERRFEEKKDSTNKLLQVHKFQYRNKSEKTEHVPLWWFE